MMNRSIWINTEFNATHCWPECPIDEVEYLRHEHRHTFKVKVQLEVIHNDRDVEFIVFKNFINEAIEQMYGKYNYQLGRRSCEDICDDLILTIRTSHFNACIIDNEKGGYKGRHLVVEVSEDGEVGARVEAS